MAVNFPPNHPYSIMLYYVGKQLGDDKAKVIDLARIMGLRRFGTIENTAELFDRLEDEDCLSEFKVTDLRKALDIIDLPEAAKVVKEYEENALEEKTSNITSEAHNIPLTDDPPPYRPPSESDAQSMPPSKGLTDEISDTDLVVEDADVEPNSTATTATALPIKEEGMPVEEIEKLIIKDCKKVEKKHSGATKSWRKYYTVSGKLNPPDYPQLSTETFVNANK